MKILLVEDQIDQAFLITEAVEGDPNINVRLTHVQNGAVALAYLQRHAPFEDVPCPDLVLLDLNMPLMDGFQVLEHRARTPALRRIPVIVLSTSTEMRDVARAYDLGCTAYMCKAVCFEQLITDIGALLRFFGETVVLPSARLPVAQRSSS